MEQSLMYLLPSYTLIKFWLEIRLFLSAAYFQVHFNYLVFLDVLFSFHLIYLKNEDLSVCNAIKYISVLCSVILYYNFQHVYSYQVWNITYNIYHYTAVLFAVKALVCLARLLFKYFLYYQIVMYINKQAKHKI